jgi:hypothetical protein
MPAWGVAFWAAAAAVLVLLALEGQMRPLMSPDTASWLAPCEAEACFAGPRFPLYAWLVRGLRWMAGDLRLLPWLQDGAFILAAWSLAHAAHRRGGSPALALALGLAPLLSCVMVIWGRVVLPDAWAQAAVLGAMAAVLGALSWRGLALAVLLATVSYLLKPGLLPVVLALPLVLLVGGARPLRRLMGLWAGLAVPFLLIATVRLLTVGDFNIVSFGGFQMSGMAALMLTPETIGHLPAALRPGAAEVVARRDALLDQRRAEPIPVNSQGLRSFPSAAAGYFDILARSYDTVLYESVRPTRGRNETWVAFNARLQHLAVATVLAQKTDYAAWVAGALARLVGRMVVFNPGMVLGVVLMAGAMVRRAVVRPGKARRDAAADIGLLVGLTSAYTIGASLLVVLITFPAARYIDGAGMLIAAWPIYAALRVAGWRADTAGSVLAVPLDGRGAAHRGAAEGMQDIVVGFDQGRWHLADRHRGLVGELPGRGGD